MFPLGEGSRFVLLMVTLKKDKVNCSQYNAKKSTISWKFYIPRKENKTKTIIISAHSYSHITDYIALWWLLIPRFSVWNNLKRQRC